MDVCSGVKKSDGCGGNRGPSGGEGAAAGRVESADESSDGGGRGDASQHRDHVVGSDDSTSVQRSVLGLARRWLRFTVHVANLGPHRANLRRARSVLVWRSPIDRHRPPIDGHQHFFYDSPLGTALRTYWLIGYPFPIPSSHLWQLNVNKRLVLLSWNAFPLVGASSGTEPTPNENLPVGPCCVHRNVGKDSIWRDRPVNETLGLACHRRR